MTTLELGTVWMKKLQRKDQFAPLAVIKASSLVGDENSMVSRMVKRRRIENGNCDGNGVQNSIVANGTTAIRHARNGGLADMFDELSKLHKSCQLTETDVWRTYHYALISGRLRNLDFDITNHREVLKRLSGIKGFGESVMSKVKEYLKTGRCEKLAELKRDPVRMGVRNLTKIHGVGPKKVCS